MLSLLKNNNLNKYAKVVIYSNVETPCTVFRNIEPQVIKFPGRIWKMSTFINNGNGPARSHAIFELGTSKTAGNLGSQTGKERIIL